MSVIVPLDGTVAVACLQDVMAKVMLVPEFAEKCVSVLTENDVIAILKGAKFPMSGVIYGGITGAQGSDQSRQGMGADVSCTVVIIVQGNAIGNTDQKNEAARLLDAIRKNIRLTVSPTGHKWRFIREIPVSQAGNAVIYSQRWTTFIALTS